MERGVLFFWNTKILVSGRFFSEQKLKKKCLTQQGRSLNLSDFEVQKKFSPKTKLTTFIRFRPELIKTNNYMALSELYQSRRFRPGK